MKKKRIIFLVVQTVLLVIAGVFLFQYVQDQIKTQIAYIFVNDLPSNTKITKNDVKAVEIPSSAIASNFMTNCDPIYDEDGNLLSEGIDGMYTASKVFKGQYIIKEMLIHGEDIDPFEVMDLTKLRKISLPISYETGFGGNIKRGDKVDLVFVGEGEKRDENGNGKRFTYSKMFLQEAFVYNVVTEYGFMYEDYSTRNSSKKIAGEEISTSSDSNTLSVITIAVTPEQSEEIYARINKGKISLVGRFENSQSYETLGYVLGEYDNIFTGNVSVEKNTIEIEDQIIITEDE